MIGGLPDALNFLHSRYRIEWLNNGKSPTYSLPYSLTYTIRYSSATASRVSTFTSLSLTLFLPQNFVLAHARALVEEGMGRGSPITSIVRPTSAYFDKSSRSTFCASVARFSHLNSLLNRAATYLLIYLLTYLLTYLLDHGRLPSSIRHR